MQNEHVLIKLSVVKIQDERAFIELSVVKIQDERTFIETQVVKMHDEVALFVQARLSSKLVYVRL